LRTREELFIVTFSVDGEVIGIAPLEIDSHRLFGQRIREIGFIGARSEVDRPVFLFPDQPALCMKLLARFLTSRNFEWDSMAFFEQSDPALIAILDQHMEHVTYQSRLFDDTVSTTIAISGSWQEYLAGKSQKFRKNLKAAKKKLDAQGALVYRHCKDGPDATVA